MAEKQVQTHSTGNARQIIWAWLGGDELYLCICNRVCVCVWVRVSQQGQVNSRSSSSHLIPPPPIT